jgi:hypothetical protein
VYNPAGEKPFLYPTVYRGNAEGYLPSAGVVPTGTSQPEAKDGGPICYVRDKVAMPPPIFENALVYPPGGGCGCYNPPAVGWNNGNLVQRGMTVTQTLGESSYGVLRNLRNRSPKTFYNK